MAVTWTKKMTLIHDFSPKLHLWIPVLSTADVGSGAMVTYDATNKYIDDEIDTVTDDSVFIGVAQAESLQPNTKEIPVFPFGVFKAALVSATYSHGAGLKYDATANDGTLVADAGANTVAWFWSLTNGLPGSGATSITEGYVYVNVPLLMSNAGTKLWAVATT